MSIITKSRRRQQRYRVSNPQGAVVEFELTGRPYRLPILNLSASGVSFAIPPDGAGDLLRLEEGTSIPDARVRIGECLVGGDLMVMHMTRSPETRQICGALLYPATDTDLIKLKSVIAGLEVAETDGA